MKPVISSCIIVVILCFACSKDNEHVDPIVNIPQGETELICKLKTHFLNDSLRIEYEYNEDGNEIGQKSYLNDELQSIYVNYLHDSAGNIIKYDRINSYRNDTTTITAEYNTDNNPLWIKLTFSHGYSNTTTWKYNEMGYLIGKISYTYGNGDKIELKYYNHDRNGNVIFFEHFIAETLYSKTFNTYNSDQNILTSNVSFIMGHRDMKTWTYNTVGDEDGYTIIFDGEIRYQRKYYEYDINGNITDWFGYDGDGNQYDSFKATYICFNIEL